MRYLLIVYVPLTHAQQVRDALARAGAGRIGNYDNCSFSWRGTGRFRPLKGSDPHIGSVGQIEEVEEERIEVVIDDDLPLSEVLKQLRAVHPYDEPAIHVVPLSDVV